MTTLYIFSVLLLLDPNSITLCYIFYTRIRIPDEKKKNNIDLYCLHRSIPIPLFQYYDMILLQHIKPLCRNKRLIQSIRDYRVMAIESSCDDSCVALLEKSPSEKQPIIIDQFKKTLHSADIGGIMPTAAYNYHMATMAKMVREFCSKHGISSLNPPDLLCVTRGPGMPGSLSASTEFAKGLSVAWNVPLIGVHHMLGHLLTANLPKKDQPNSPPPQYPFLSLLCSGGHTMLVLLKSLTEHEIIINVCDIAVGDSLDKCARELGMYGNMLGKELEKYIDAIPFEEKQEFDNMNVDTRISNELKFRLTLPFGAPKHGISEDIKFAFAHFLSNIQEYKANYYPGGDKLDERTKKFIAYKTQEFVFDHIVDRINISFKKHGLCHRNSDGILIGVKDFICSGGVAANKRLREKLLTNLKIEELGTDKINFHFPDLSLCTDNAIMIGAAGIEIFEQLRLKTDLGFTPIKKWPLDNLLDVPGWEKIDDEEYNRICK